MKRIVLTLVAMMCCTLASSLTDAAPDEATIKLAKSHYEKGNAAYNLGKFDEAVNWYTKAYEAWPAPDLLYNIAQSYRLAGNCNQALFLYRRYLSIKDRDKDTPLSREERAEIERFIKELSDCEALIKAKPDGPKPPTPSPTGQPANLPPRRENSPAQPQKPTRPTAAIGTEPEGEDPEILASTLRNAKLISVYANGGVAVILGGGKLSTSVQPSFAVGANYPLLVDLLMLDVGAHASYSPIRYDAMNIAKLASLIGIRATLGGTYQVNAKLDVRGDVGIGVARLHGLVSGNPFTDTGKASEFTMLSLRVGLAAEYAVTPNVVATVAPLSLSFCPAPDGLVMGSLTQFDVLIGVRYRM